MAERGPRAARPYDSTAGVSTACASIAICGQGLGRSPSSCSSATGHGTAVGATVLALSGSRAATPCHAGPSLCSSVAGPAAPADAAVLLLHSSRGGGRAAALSPLHTGSRPLLPGGHFLPAMPTPHSPSAVQLSGQGSPSATAARHRPASAVLPFKCPQEDRMGQGGGTGAGTGTSDATQPHQTQLHQLPASSACAARLNPLLAPLPPPSQRSRSLIDSGTASPCCRARVGGSSSHVHGSDTIGSRCVGSGAVSPCSSARLGGGSGTSVGGSLVCGDGIGGSGRTHGSGTNVRSSLDCGGGSVGGSSLLCGSSTDGGGTLDCRGSSVGSSSLLSGGSSRTHGGSTDGCGSLDVGGGSGGSRSLLSSGSTLLSGGSSSTRSLASHSPATSHNGDASFHFSTSPPCNALLHAAPHLLSHPQPETSSLEVDKRGVHAPAAAVAVGAVRAVGAGSEAAGAEAAETTSTTATAATTAVGSGQSPGRWTQLEAALTMAPPPAPWQHTPARPPAQPHAPSACMHLPPGSLSLGLAHSQAELVYARQQQQEQQQQQQQQQQALCHQQCEDQQGQERHGSSRGSSRGSSNMSSSRGAIRGGTDAPRCPDAPDSTDIPGVLLVNGALAGPAVARTDTTSTAGDAADRAQPVIVTAAEGQLQQQLGGGDGEEGQTQPGTFTVTEEEPQLQLGDGEVDALGPQADEAAEESDAEAEGRVVEAENRGEEVDGAVGRKKKKKRKAKAGERALKANGSNASNSSIGSTACGGPSNSSSRCGGSRRSNSSGRVGDVTSGVGCGSRGSNVSRGVGDGSRGSSCGMSAPAVVDAQGGRNGCASTCSSGSASAGVGDSGKCATMPLQGPPNGPLSSDTCPVSVVGQGPSAKLANSIGRASPSPGAAKGRSISTGRGCGALQGTVRLDGGAAALSRTSDTLRQHGSGVYCIASSSVHCSPARTSRRNPAFNTMPLPPLAATQLPSRNFQEHSAFHTSVASVTSRFGPGEPLVARSGGSSGGRGSVTGVMSQAEGEVAGREALDLREERRKAHERLEAYSKAKQAKAQEAAMEDANRRRAIQDARNAHKAAKERQREEVYALNAILRMSEQAFINQLLEAAARSVRRMSKDEHSQLEAAAEHAAAVAAAAASAGGAAGGHAAAAVVGAASAGGAVAENAAHATTTAAAADSARGPGALSPEGSFSSSVHDSPSSVRQAAGASDAVVLGVGGVRGAESVGGSGGRSRPASALVVLAAAAASRPQSALGRALRAHPALPGSASGAAGSTTSTAAGAGGSTGGSTGRVTAGTADTAGTKAGAVAGSTRGRVTGHNVAGAGDESDGDDVDGGFIAEDGEGSDREQADVSLVQSILSRMTHGV